MSIVEVKVPDIGDFKEVEIIELMIKVGDTIKVDQSLITVESDKASMEIPSSAAGVVKEIKVKVGDKVAEGSLLLLVEADGAAAAPAAAPAAAAAPAPAAAAPAPAPAAAPASAASAGPVEVKVPDIGDFKEVEVIEVMVKVGDTIKVDQSLLTVESDKASMEIPSSHAGVVKEVKIKVGDKVAMGTVVLVVDAVGGAAAPAPAAAAPAAAAPAPVAAPAAAPAPAAAAAATTASQGSVQTGKLAHASPSIRKFARELGVDLGKVPGSGPKGRITQLDVQNYVKGVMAGTTAAPAGASAPAGSGGGMSVLPWPVVDFSKFGPTELLPLSRIKKISGPNLHRNWVMIPHVTQFDDADITDLEAFRVETNNANAKNKDAAKLTMLAFVIKASVAALKKFPSFNASLDEKGENLILKQYYNIGFAADTPNGLVVPVIKNADQKSVSQIAREMTELSLQAREGKLKPTDMQGASFTISSLGGIGGTHFTPIVNAPEVAILGLSKASIKPVWDGKAFQPRLMMGTSLSYDHRVVDGAMGARFSVYLSEVLGDMRKILL
ncbi:dihydrolipoyllysine-residue acetyltransferase [Duganella sp. BJB488]|uniref:dihydrolipoyllysine-residue acetyltransferase n=1 Tax=unclassified Duganella TaxID=2636909 RepID=UPI000E35236C|nr:MULTISPECIES: dihydrolipoyllysine-residue acetyltransferase [unclassified Duganella]NVD73591.1 dihydrolipoyllysine-residue acetyltransferase [Duganella sp. BJB1802]RFP26027.1 dihydrolipoyllysine-residue acetyltransferase [Duganella sp. BJB489]RFP28232.1 dihydrolipoyllysine-residue acetyltransferase [Duganella sp. BJB488]RFP36957.1 dihydrolipoyllysine-residue acetyltransferase [Duganella sp. BJB480]